MNKSKRQKVKDLIYNPGFLSNKEKNDLEEWLQTLHPLWEMRYSEHCPPPPGDWQRPLLRPVYWLGNWQFACLGYYEPPKRTQNCAIVAEVFPDFLKKIVKRIEEQARRIYHNENMPRDWELNTCLINFYGDIITKEGQREDRARVGEHKDFEPGPVASLSLGEKCLFQFVTGKPKTPTQSNIIHQEWPDHGSLLLFGGPLWKERYFHRVQRVENKKSWSFKNCVPHFETRRVNLTLRYVPKNHWTNYNELPTDLASDIKHYIEELAKHHTFYKNLLEIS